MKLASIDIGTNSTRLLISGCKEADSKQSECKKESYNNSGFTTIAREMAITRPGRDLNKTGLISEQSEEETIKVLAGYIRKIREEGVERFRVIGTSALRRAKNTAEFKKLIKDRLGINIEVITGEEEARLSFYGALGGVDFNGLLKLYEIIKTPESSKNILVMDIGGGSTEFILGSMERNIILANSVDIGCVNLTEKFIRNPAGKPDKQELIRLNEFIRVRLLESIKVIREVGFSIVIGLAGTISTLAAVDMGLTVYNKNKIHHHILTEDKIRRIYDLLCSVSLEERKKIAGLDPKRADIIISGTAILLQIMDMLDVGKILVSEDDILDGIVYSLL